MKSISLRDLRSGLLTATTADCRSQRTSALSLALLQRDICDLPELWVSHFEPESERHSMDGTTRLQGREN
jgi:hypothetical protein